MGDADVVIEGASLGFAMMGEIAHPAKRGTAAIRGIIRFMNSGFANRISRLACANRSDGPRDFVKSMG